MFWGFGGTYIFSTFHSSCFVFRFHVVFVFEFDFSIVFGFLLFLFSNLKFQFGFLSFLFSNLNLVYFVGGAKPESNMYDLSESEVLINSDEIDGYISLKKMVRNSNKKLVAPYRNQKIIDFFLSHSWNELNTPLQKNLSYEAFYDYFKKLKVYRESSSLPINSKITEWHQTIFSSKLNTNHRKHLDEIIQDILQDKT